MHGKKIENKLAEKLKTNFSVMTVHSNSPVSHPDLEQKFYNWITAQHKSEIAVSTASIIAKLLAIDFVIKTKN